MLYNKLNLKSDRSVILFNKGLSIGKKAPNFELPASTNETISLTQFTNQPVVLVFFRGTW